MTFDSINVRHDHDWGFSGEWDNLWVGVNGKWIELSGPSGHYGLDDVDDDQEIVFPTGSKTATVMVPENGELKIQTTGWEDDNDGYYGRSLLRPPPPIGALNDNDKIGYIQSRYCSMRIVGYCAGNFGIGPQIDASKRDGDADTAGDFALGYRIEQLSLTPPPPPTTKPPPPPETPLPPICKIRPWLPQCKDLM